MSLDPAAYLDALLALPDIGPAAISPDGTWAAWTWSGVGSTADVFVAPTDGSAIPLRLTASAENAVLVSWVSDSRAVVIGQDHEGDERVQLFRVDLDQPGLLQPLTDAAPSYFLRGGQLHPNGRWLVYAMNFDVVTGQEIEPFWIYRHDVLSGERVPLARPGKPSYFGPQLNHAGTHVLYHRQEQAPGDSQVWLVDIDGHDDRELLDFGPGAKIAASWFPDGRQVIFLLEKGAERRVGVWSLDSSEITWLAIEAAHDLESVFVPRGIEPPVAVLVRIQQARLRSSLLDLQTEREIPLPDRTGTLIPYQPVRNGEWVGRYYNSTQPDDLVRFRPVAAAVDGLTSLTRVWERTPLRSADLVPAEDFHWCSADGLEIQGWLYRPDGPARGTIVRVHGGPTAHNEDILVPAIQFFVRQGFAVLTPNYRGSTGFGLAFREAIKVDGWGGREQDDIRAGIEALISAGIAEPGKVGITGTSYGGYSSWCAITRWPPEVVAAAAPICGMTDLIVDYQTTRPDLRPYSEEMLGGRPDQVPERYHERSPIHFVDAIRGRLLIVQGLHDPNVTPENLHTVEQALRRHGIAHAVLTFENEGHGIRLPANQRILLLRLFEFFDQAFNHSYRGSVAGEDWQAAVGIRPS